MTLIVHDMPQGSPEWFSVRAGKPTASEFATVLAKGKDGGASVTRETYMNKLAGEIYTGEPMENYVSADMLRGKEQEDAARDRYALLHDADPVRVGFLEETDIRAGASPDALLGNDGLLELKSAAPHVLIHRLKRDKFPAEHVAQCQGGLWISGREWIDIALHCPKLPLFVKRAYRDEKYIRTLTAEVLIFNEELEQTVERVRRYGEPDASTNIVKAQLRKSLAKPELPANIFPAG